MTKEVLSKYRSRVIRIAKLKDDIEDIKLGDVQVVAGKVNSSMKDFPYIPCRTSVEMNDPVEVEKQRKQIARKRKEIDRLEQLNRDVEEFIESIQDPTAKSVFEYYYTDGTEKMTQKEIADKVSISKGHITEVISKYINKSA